MTVRGSEYDVAIQCLPDSKRGLAMALGCRPHLMQLDAQLGAFDSVLYPTMQMALKGARAIAVTDCLNFGNPEKDHIMSEFVASVEAIRDFSLEFKAPVISGNVSFYNETLGENITSTPATGVVGIRPNVQQIPEDHFQKKGSLVYRISCSQVFSKGLIALKTNEKNEFFGNLDLKALHQFQEKLIQLSYCKGVLSNQMVGRGGLLLSLARMCQGNIGFKAQQKLSYYELVQEVFYQTLWEVDSTRAKEFTSEATKLNLKTTLLGETAQGFFEIGEFVTFNVQDLVNSYRRGLGGQIEIMA